VVSADGDIIAPRLSAVREVLPGSFGWSPDGESLAFLGYPAGSANSRLRAYRYGMKQRTLSVLTTGELELTPPTEAGGARSVLRWSGSRELLLFNRNSANDLAGQSHVWDCGFCGMINTPRISPAP
jgi:hypothetical protein